MVKNTKNNAKSTNKLLWILPVVVLILGFAAFFAYNKYLNSQNIAEMEQLLADFEKLKEDAEKETGQSYYIEATCGTGSEKFSNQYYCRVVLSSFNENGSSYYNEVESTLFTNNKCEQLVNGIGGFKNSIRCDLTVRQSNSEKAEEIFYEYDTTPGRAF
jgi:hypothetical protein